MTNRFTHSLKTWPKAKARIIDNMAELQAMLDDLVKAFPDGANHARDTLSQLTHVNNVLTPKP